jgi:hypothetical protein
MFDVYCVANPRDKSAVEGETLCRPRTGEVTRTYLMDLVIVVET